MYQQTITALLGLLVMAVLLSCKDEIPQRGQIPKIKATLYAVQEAVRTRNRSALDTLLTRKARKQDRGDSLIAFVSVFYDTRPFARFVDSNIFYTESFAQVECYAVDSVDSVIRPVNLIFTHNEERWWLHSFNENVNEDSL